MVSRFSWVVDNSGYQWNRPSQVSFSSVLLKVAATSSIVSLLDWTVHSNDIHLILRTWKWTMLFGSPLSVWRLLQSSCLIWKSLWSHGSQRKDFCINAGADQFGCDLCTVCGRQGVWQTQKQGCKSHHTSGRHVFPWHTICGSFSVTGMRQEFLYIMEATWVGLSCCTFKADSDWCKRYGLDAWVTDVKRGEVRVQLQVLFPHVEWSQTRIPGECLLHPDRDVYVISSSLTFNLPRRLLKQRKIFCLKHHEQIGSSTIQKHS